MKRGQRKKVAFSAILTAASLRDGERDPDVAASTFICQNPTTANTCTPKMPRDGRELKSAELPGTP